MSSRRDGTPSRGLTMPVIEFSVDVRLMAGRPDLDHLGMISCSVHGYSVVWTWILRARRLIRVPGET